MQTPIESLLSVPETVQAHAPPDVAAWFDQGMAAFMAGDGTLDAAMGLSVNAGERSAVTQYRNQQRLHHLRQAWEIIRPDLKPWPRAGKLSEAINKFQAGTWPAWREYDSPPAGASRLHTALFMARKHGELPASQRQLNDLFKANTETSYRMYFSQPLV